MRHLLQDLRRLLAEGVASRAWPGGVLQVVDRDTTLASLSYGFHTYKGMRPTRRTDLFDAASLSKVVATTTLAMLLTEDGSLDLDRCVGDILPEFVDAVPAQRAQRRRVSIRHLLTHASGLPAYVPFHLTAADCDAERRSRVMSVALEAEPGIRAVYSDVGMMLLGFSIERLCGDTLDRLVRARMCIPLKMTHTRYRPPPSARHRVVPTECVGDGGRALQGVVHDENARWLGGVAGHAGLFVAAGDLGRFARMMLRGGELDGVRLLDEGTIRLFTCRAGVVPGSSRCLGWDSPSGKSSGGDHLSPGSFGHTGFTGTSLWIDPGNNVAVMLLTNAVHPRRECRGENGFFERRRRIHSAVYEALGYDPR